MIRYVQPDDAHAIALIYNYYIEHTTVTFATDSISTEEMRNRIITIAGKYPFFVYEESGKVIGFCFASAWKEKKASKNTVESTIYIDKSFQGKGVGYALMSTLIDELRTKSFHAVIACIAIPHPSSVKLHEKLGFRKVSEFKEVGYKFGKWLDVSDWELLL